MQGRNASGRGVPLLNHGSPLPSVVPPRPRAEVFPFLKLPAEIRNIIYNYVMRPKTSINVYVHLFRNSINTGLLYANRQISGEASTVLYANVRGIVCNERHYLLSRSCCCQDYMIGPFHSMLAHSKDPYLRSPLSSIRKLQRHRHPDIRNIQPSVLARMAELEISLGWLPEYFPHKDTTEATKSILCGIAVLLQRLCDILGQMGEQEDKTIALTFGNLL